MAAGERQDRQGALRGLRAPDATQCHRTSSRASTIFPPRAPEYSPERFCWLRRRRRWSGGRSGGRRRRRTRRAARGTRTRCAGGGTTSSRPLRWTSHRYMQASHLHTCAACVVIRCSGAASKLCGCVAQAITKYTVQKKRKKIMQRLLQATKVATSAATQT